MYKSIALILLALGLTQASLVPVGELLRMRQIKATTNYDVAMAEGRADASAYVDLILANLRTLIKTQGLDHVALPDLLNYQFSETILGVTWHGEFSLNKGHLEGLETIHRTGVADITTEPNGDTVITVEGGVNDGALGYTGIVKFMNLGPTIDVTGTLKSVRVQLTIRIGANLLPHLDKLDIKNLGTLSLDIKGLGAILNFLAELIVNVVGNLVKDVVGELLQGIIKDLLNQVIEGLLPPPPTPRFVFQAAPAGFKQAIPYIR